MNVTDRFVREWTKMLMCLQRSVCNHETAYSNIYIYIYIYKCVCVCVCDCNNIFITEHIQKCL